MLRRSSSLLALAVAVALAPGLLPTAPDAADADTPYRPVYTGFATPDFRDDLPDYAAAVGRAPSLYQLFWDLGDGWPNAWAAGILTELEGLGVGAAYVEITTSDLDSLILPGPNAQLDALVSSVAPWLEAAPDRYLLVAPLPESNLAGHAYGGDPAAYKTGYLKIRSAFRDAGLGPDKVRFVFAMNGLSDAGLSYPMFYPGDDFVDVVAFAKVNRGSPWRDFDTTFAMHIVEMNQLTATKPILVSQTASVDVGGDRSQWLTDMFGLLPGFDQVIGSIYYNGVPSLGFQVVGASGVDPGFASGAASWTDADDIDWLFDDRMDAWVAEREVTQPSLSFIDTAASPFVLDIEWLAEAGITAGCNPPVNDRFCPDAYVTRGQMAAFLVRALGLPAGAGGDSFWDDDDSVFEADIERLAAAGITTGCGDGRFCPDAYVTRGQMAAFMHRAFST